MIYPLIIAGGALAGFVAAKLSVGLPKHIVSKEFIPTVTHPLVEKVATTGKAVGAAALLHDYLKAHAYDGTDTLHALVTDFQQDTNSDPDAKTLSGPVPVTGTYDPATSSALTMYTKDPIPADPKSAPTPAQKGKDLTDITLPSAAYQSAFNLQTYLVAHGNDKSAILQTLTKAFQHDVNTDPKYPGPAYNIPGVSAALPRFVTTPLKEDGVYGPGTANAMGPIIIADNADQGRKIANGYITAKGH